MASSDIREFNLADADLQDLNQYIWRSRDMWGLQEWLKQMVRMLAEGGFGAGVLSGLTVLPAGGLSVQTAAGIASNSSGRLMYLPTASTSTFAADGSNPVRHLLVLRPVDTNMTSIPKPTDPLTSIYLHKQLSYQLVVIAGTPGATPQYPAKLTDDVIVMGIKLTAGHTTITSADLDYSVVDRPRSHVRKVRAVASAYSVADDDEIIEVAATGGDVTVTIPTAIARPGREIGVVLVDGASGVCNVAAQGAELISGQSVISLDAQWDRTRIYSNGTAWRVL